MDMALPSFSLGQLVATPGALEALARNGSTGLEYLQKHASGHWGDLGDEDKSANEAALRTGARIMSAYRLGDGTRIRVHHSVSCHCRFRASSCVLPCGSPRTVFPSSSQTISSFAFTDTCSPSTKLAEFMLHRCRHALPLFRAVTALSLRLFL